MPGHRSMGLPYLGALLLAGVSGPVLAQASVAPPATTAEVGSQASATTPAGGSVGVGEIVVTAQKRSENLQTVPIAITAVSGGELTRQRVLTTRDVQFLTPSLLYTQAANNAQPYLRGIGSDLPGPNLDASVATYVDGVYIASTQGTVTGLIGIDHIEVLEGPQGTLFGRNAVGGAISIYTLTPKHELEAAWNVTGGDYDRTSTSGYVSGPVTDNLLIGGYFSYDRRHTFEHILGNANTEWEQRGGGRLKAVWTPIEAVKLTGSVEYTASNGTEAGALRNIQPDALGYALGATSPIKTDTYDSDLPQGTRIKNWAYTLREEAGLGFADLLGITGYRRLRTKTVNDLDGVNIPLLADFAVLHDNQFSQELQLLSPRGNAIKWIIGGYYFHDNVGYFPTGISSDIVYQPAPYQSVLTTSRVITNSFAAFGQITFPLDFLLPGLNFTAGGRYSHDHKTFTAHNSFVSGDGISGQDPEVAPSVYFDPKSASFHKFTPKATLEYQAGKTLIYATYSQGFKSGAFNISSPNDPNPVGPEKLTAYEVGTKSTFFDNRVRLNTSAYYYKFSDLQVDVIDPSQGGINILQNAGAGHAYGIEAALTVAPTRGLTLNGSVAWEHTRFTDFRGAASFDIGPAGNTSVSIDDTGNQLSRAPKVTFNLGADYTFDLANGSSIDANAKWYHNGGFFWEPSNRFREGPYSVVNLSLGYAFPDKRLSVTGFVSNLTNDHYRTSLLLLPTSIDTSDAEPRMYGVTLGWKL